MGTMAESCPTQKLKTKAKPKSYSKKLKQKQKRNNRVASRKALCFIAI
jgi:hypothetical protein